MTETETLRNQNKFLRRLFYGETFIILALLLLLVVLVGISVNDQARLFYELGDCNQKLELLGWEELNLSTETDFVPGLHSSPGPDPSSSDGHKQSLV